MIANAKALVVVLALALSAFYICRPVAIQFMREETFQRRRNVWIALTTLGFLSPTFWIWAFFASGILIWSALRDRNPIGLFCLVMFAVPHVSLRIPAPLIDNLFDLSVPRLLVLTIVLVELVRSRSQRPAAHRWSLSDTVLLAYLVLQVLLLVPYETVTHTMRRTFLLTIDIFLLFYVFARPRIKEHVADAVACFWLATAVMAPIGLFESVRGWLLYTGINDLWGDPNTFAWLMRDSSLRAQAATGHSLNFGYHIAIGIATYLYLRSRRALPRLVDACVIAVMAAALYVSHSRGAWVTAAVAVAAFMFLRPMGVRRATPFFAFSATAVVVMFASPLRSTVLDRLPFIGSADQETIEYRQQLLERSWSIVAQNPWFGDPFAMLRMESLRQGQGIIDIVNGYLYAALFTGYVGLLMLSLILAIPLWRGWNARRRAATHDVDAQELLAMLMSVLGGTIVFIATAGTGPSTYILAALLVSLAATMMAAAPQPQGGRDHSAWSAFQRPA